MNRKWFVFFMVFTVVLGLGFPAPGASKSQGEYVIGLSLDLTGNAANIGVAENRVYQMKTKEINNAGGIHGRMLRLVTYDAESQPAKAVINTKKLIDVDKAIGLLGYSSTGTTLACVETATTGKTLLFSLASSEKIWIPTKKWVFNTTPRQLDACTPILVESLIQKGSGKIAYVYNDTAYGQTGKETFEVVCKQKAIKPALIEGYAPNATDVTPQITHVKTSGANGLIVCGYLADTAKLLRTAKEMGFSYPIFSEYAIVGPEFISLVGKYGEGVVTTSLKTLVAPDLADDDIQKKVCMDLYQKYTSKYGAFSLYAGHAWDSLNLTVKALEKVDPKLDPSKEVDLKKIRSQLRDNLENLKGIVGQNGVYNYSANNHNGLGPGCYVPVVIKEGQWHLYK